MRNSQFINHSPKVTFFITSVACIPKRNLISRSVFVHHVQRRSGKIFYVTKKKKSQLDADFRNYSTIYLLRGFRHPFRYTVS